MGGPHRICFIRARTALRLKLPVAGPGGNRGLVDSIRIVGGNRLVGSVPISGAKNAALPILAAALLADGEHVFRNVPNLRDVHTMTRLLERLGAQAEYTDGRVQVTLAGPIEPTAPYDLVKQMRASVLVLGPLVARCGRAVVSLPGGCAIGARPIDQHLKGLSAMGADLSILLEVVYPVVLYMSIVSD